MNRRSLSRVLALGALVLLPFAPAALASAAPPPPTPPAEAYPPAAVVNLLDPFGCNASSISGNIGAVLPGSTVTLELQRTSGGEVLTTVTATAGADGHALYTIPIPPNRFGPVVIRATGTNTVGQPFTIETASTIEQCPTGIPATGAAGITTWLRGGTAAVLAGVALVVVAMRRRRKTLDRAV